MILEHHLDLPAEPDVVFALINDVETVAGCLPGAVLDGREDDVYLGRVTFKVGPVTAAYAGRVRFTEVVPGERRLRLSARGADSHGHGDAEADVLVTVTPAPGGCSLDLRTDLVVRGKLAQFGKAAITTVSGRLLAQFARNLSAHLGAATAPAVDPAAAPGTPTAAVTPATPPATPADTADHLDGLAMLLPPNAGRYAAAGGALLLAFLQGWLLGRLRAQQAVIDEMRRHR